MLKQALLVIGFSLSLATPAFATGEMTGAPPSGAVLCGSEDAHLSKGTNNTPVTFNTNTGKPAVVRPAG